MGDDELINLDNYEQASVVFNNLDLDYSALLLAQSLSSDSTTDNTTE